MDQSYPVASGRREPCNKGETRGPERAPAPEGDLDDSHSIAARGEDARLRVDGSPSGATPLQGRIAAWRVFLPDSSVTRYLVTRYGEVVDMAEAADRMKAMRARRRVAKEVASLNRAHELEALRWIEAVSEFDAQ
jgi:hypothetical protein